MHSVKIKDSGAANSKSGNIGVMNVSGTKAFSRQSVSSAAVNSINNNLSTTAAASTRPAIRFHDAKESKGIAFKKPARAVVPTAPKFSLDDFGVGRKLGQGKFGFVHIAKEKKSNKKVALKIMWKSDLESHELLHQVRREVEIHARVKHKNIVKMYSYFDDEERVYLVLEYVPGGDVLEMMNKFPAMRMPEEQASRVMRGLVEAVNFCHANKILHRDIKPENILITPDGTVKLADFGWACSDDTERAIERMKRTTFCGTLDYLPPELSRREVYDYRADIWMTGCVCYEMLVGCAPFYHEDVTQTTNNIESKDELKLPKYISDDARDLLRKMLVKDQEKRMKKIYLALIHPWITKYATKEENTKIHDWLEKKKQKQQNNIAAKGYMQPCKR